MPEITILIDLPAHLSKFVQNEFGANQRLLVEVLDLKALQTKVQLLFFANLMSYINQEAHRGVSRKQAIRSFLKKHKIDEDEMSLQTLYRYFYPKEGKVRIGQK